MAFFTLDINVLLFREVLYFGLRYGDWHKLARGDGVFRGVLWLMATSQWNYKMTHITRSQRSTCNVYLFKYPFTDNRSATASRPLLLRCTVLYPTTRRVLEGPVNYPRSGHNTGSSSCRIFHRHGHETYPPFKHHRFRALPSSPMTRKYGNLGLISVCKLQRLFVESSPRGSGLIMLTDASGFLLLGITLHRGSPAEQDFARPNRLACGVTR